MCFVPCHVTTSLFPVVQPPEAPEHQQGCKWEGLCYLQLPHPTWPREKRCPATAQLTVQLRERHHSTALAQRVTHPHLDAGDLVRDTRIHLAGLQPLDCNCCEYYSTEALQLMSRNWLWFQSSCWWIAQQLVILGGLCLLFSTAILHGRKIKILSSR